MPNTPDITPKHAPPRDDRGRILKGHSLNPGGRPKSLAASIRAELGNGERLYQRMIRIWEGEEEGFGARERLEAGKWLADRGFGKAPETQIQIQADAEQVEGATELASDALTSLADHLGSIAPESEKIFSGGVPGTTSEKVTN